MTLKWYATLRQPKMHPHAQFGIPTSKNIGNIYQTRKDGLDAVTFGYSVRKSSQESVSNQQILGHFYREISEIQSTQQGSIRENGLTDGRTVRLLYASKSSFGVGA